MSRNLVAYLLMLSVLGACSSTRIGGIGPHRIDVQQGNALDQESVAKLKPGLTRSQVRFLLGTPLLVDPFHPNRWDYVYTFHKAGKLTEQKRITLYFDNDILQRMEGDVPIIEEAATPTAAPATAPAVVAPAESKSTAAESIPVGPAKKPEPVATPTSTAPSAAPSSATPSVSSSAPAVAPAPPIQPAPVSAAASAIPATPAARPNAPIATSATTAAATSVVAPLGSSTASPSPAARRSSDLQLNPETNVAQIQPNVIPAFPVPNSTPTAKATDASILAALQAWADAWAKGNADAYIAAYATDYTPFGGDTHAAWEKRRRSLLGIAKNVELRIEAPKVKMTADGHALVTFKQYYRSTNVRDDLVKQIKFAQHDGRWVIVEEQVVSTLQAPKL